LNKNIIFLAMLSAGVLLFPLTYGQINPFSLKVLIPIGIYVILAVSLDLLMGYTGQISLGHAGFYALGAYASGLSTVKLQLSPLLGLAISVLLVGIVSLVIGYAVLRLKGYYLIIATLSFGLIVIGLITSLQNLTGGGTGLSGIPDFSLFGFSFDTATKYFYLVWFFVVLTILWSLGIVHSRFGRAISAIHTDELAASCMAINPTRYKVQIFVFTAILAGIAGSLFAHYLKFLAPDDFNLFVSIDIIIMVFVGGVGTIFGPLLGAFLLKLLPEMLYGLKDYELIAHGLILILILVFVPGGILGIIKYLRAQIKSPFKPKMISR
jgi:branched-chain amino acid transport system permease protein